MNYIKNKLRASLRDILMDDLVHLRVNSTVQLDYRRVSRELAAGHGEPVNKTVFPVYPKMDKPVLFAK